MTGGHLKLNLGCGLNAPPGWINIDASLTARLSMHRKLYNVLCKLGHIEPIAWPKNIKISDVRKGIPFPDNSARAIFSHHMLEHMDYEDADFVIREGHRCLCEGGVIRIIVPDLYTLAKRYVDSMNSDPQADHSHDFLRVLNMHDQKHKGALKIVYKICGHSKHRYMYDYWSLKRMFSNNGFIDIQKMKYGESRIPDVNLVEGTVKYDSSLCLEGIKR